MPGDTALYTGKVPFLGKQSHPLSVSFQYTINPPSDSYVRSSQEDTTAVGTSCKWIAVCSLTWSVPSTISDHKDSLQDIALVKTNLFGADPHVFLSKRNHGKHPISVVHSAERRCSLWRVLDALCHGTRMPRWGWVHHCCLCSSRVQLSRLEPAVTPGACSFVPRCERDARKSTHRLWTLQRMEGWWRGGEEEVKALRQGCCRHGGGGKGGRGREGEKHGTG
eukprot:1810043-Rhodomonas_salina.3